LGALISRLASFFSLTKTVAVTVPGLIGAAAFVLFLWPPEPVNLIQTPVNLAAVRQHTEDHCRFDAEPRALGNSNELAASAIKQTARQNQVILERARDDLQECLAIETSHVGEEAAVVQNLQYQIGVLETERSALQTQYLAYVKARSDLASEYQAKLDARKRDIQGKQTEIMEVQKSAKSRQLNIDTENRYLKTVNDRLADAGRLRPQQDFDAVLTGVSNHVVAFAVLALILGYALTPLNRALYGGVFDWALVGFWNGLRSRRFRVQRPKGIG
jgi:hypothetical protein